MAGTITALVVQKRNKERVNVYLDGEFAFGLAMIEALKLHKGQTLSDEEIERLRALDEVETAHERALNLLTYRPRSAEEVRRKLRESKKNFSETAIEKTIQRLEQAGLLDAKAFSRYSGENWEKLPPRRRRTLHRDADEPLVDVDEEDAAYRGGRAKARRYAQADEETFRRRLGGYLARRGFPYGTVRDVVDRLWDEINTQTNSP
mgnify:CR=1 FL=1